MAATVAMHHTAEPRESDLNQALFHELRGFFFFPRFLGSQILGPDSATFYGQWDSTPDAGSEQLQAAWITTQKEFASLLRHECERAFGSKVRL